MKRMLIAFAAVALLVAARPISAQDLPRAAQAPAAQAPAAQPRAQAAEPLSAQGTLVRVDSKASTLTIKTMAGIQMDFKYTDTTKVTGATGGVSGLATMADSDVTVRYTKQQSDNVATEIQVQEKK